MKIDFSNHTVLPTVNDDTRLSAAAGKLVTLLSHQLEETHLTSRLISYGEKLSFSLHQFVESAISKERSPDIKRTWRQQ
jgi:hypothetical protein